MTFRPCILLITFTLMASLCASRLPAQQPTSKIGRTVALDGMEMYYEIHGQGDTLLLLHGFSSSGREMWTPVVKQLSAKYRLLIPDLRGHGRSTNPTETFTHRQSALDVYALLDHLQVDRVSAVGVSTGGMTLLHMSTQQPERINAMILIGATHYFPKQCRDIQRTVTVEGLSQNDDMWGGYKQMRKIHVHGDEQIRKLRRQFRGFKDSYDDMNFTKSLLGTIQARTLIIHGDRDAFFPVEIPVEMYSAISSSSLWIVPDGGHVPIFGPNRFPLVLADNVPFVANALEFFDREQQELE